MLGNMSPYNHQTARPRSCAPKISTWNTAMQWHPGQAIMVSIAMGVPQKRMVYTGKSDENGWFGTQQAMSSQQFVSCRDFSDSGQLHSSSLWCPKRWSECLQTYATPFQPNKTSGWRKYPFHNHHEFLHLVLWNGDFPNHLVDDTTCS